MQTYTILFSREPNNNFVEYVGVGGKEIDPQDPEKSLLPTDRTITGWQNFIHFSGRIQLFVTLNYLRLNQEILEEFPQELKSIILTNLEEIASIISHWFIEDSAIFRYLDLLSDGTWDDLTGEEQLEDQSTKYTFNDGSTIIINEDITPKHQYFIPVDRIDQLIEDTREIYKYYKNEYGINQTKDETKSQDR